MAGTEVEGAEVVLVPGHLGVPADLGGRALPALQAAAVWVVEKGSDEALRVLARTHRLELGRARKVEFDHGNETHGEVTGPIVEALDAGGSVAIFGGDEGIPGFSDPGGALLAWIREARPGVPIRSLGGPSVLGMALMRADLHFESVLFVPGMEHPDPGEAEHRIAQVVGHVHDNADRVRWVVTFGTADQAARAVQRLLDEDRALTVEVGVAASLTRPEEAWVRATLRRGETLDVSGIAPDAPCVVFLRAEHPPTHLRTWFGRIVRQWRPWPEDRRR